MANNDKRSTEPYKGVRDFYPEDMFMQNYIFDTMREVAERYGYQEYAASLLEPTELYNAKSGDEIVSEQTYTFKDRGGRSVTLRPEMTPSVARMVAAKGRELSFPLRLYSIPNVFRYERPQKGRLREHWQLNCDIFGVSGIEAEIEIIIIASQIMKAFGATDSDFEIRLNSRKALDQAFEKLGLSESSAKELRILIDKKDKIDNFAEEAERILGKPFDPSLFTWDGFDEIRGILSDVGIPNVTYNPELVRGFDYYTGVIFEVFDTSPENKRSLFGGGRYDNLMDIFNTPSVPAVGFGMGDVTMRDFLETHNLLPAYTPTTDLVICVLERNHVGAAHKLAEKLRKAGLNVAVDYTARKVGDQIKAADKQRIKFVLCVGSDEIARGTYKVKQLTNGQETELPEDEIGDFIWSQEV
jgi:histidyl-tRNA synthetase